MKKGIVEMSRDKYGHFINDNGVEMRATEDKYGKSS